MRKIFGLFFIFAFLDGAAFGYGDWGSKTANEWWGPDVVFYRCARNLADVKEVYLNGDGDYNIKNAFDKIEVMARAFIARKLVPHGGYFCATQLRARTSSSPGDTWTDYQETKPAAKCFWMCEPGYTGENCNAASSDDMLCENIKPSKEYLKQFGQNKSKSAATDSVEIMVWHNGFMDSGFDDQCYTSPYGNQSDVIVVAHGFDQGDGHGILVSPMTFTTWHADCGSGLGLCGTFRVVSGVERWGTQRDYKSNLLLCPQGWSGPNCSKKCKECPTVKEHVVNGKCVNKDSWTADLMLTKSDKGTASEEPCWYKGALDAYKACMKK
jgi:hypothetical protein